MVQSCAVYLYSLWTSVLMAYGVNTNCVFFFPREQVINLVILSRHVRLWLYVIPKLFKYLTMIFM
jgi:hypothetical protein